LTFTALMVCIQANIYSDIGAGACHLLIKGTVL
jgi:hypothetical protein